MVYFLAQVLHVFQGAGSSWCCMRLSAAAAMVLRLSTVESSCVRESSSSLGKSSSLSSSPLFRNLLGGGGEPGRTVMKANLT